MQEETKTIADYCLPPSLWEDAMCDICSHHNQCIKDIRSLGGENPHLVRKLYEQTAQKLEAMNLQKIALCVLENGVKNFNGLCCKSEFIEFEKEILRRHYIVAMERLEQRTGRIAEDLPSLPAKGVTGTSGWRKGKSGFPVFQ